MTPGDRYFGLSSFPPQPVNWLEGGVVPPSGQAVFRMHPGEMGGGVSLFTHHGTYDVGQMNRWLNWAANRLRRRKPRKITRWLARQRRRKGAA